MKTNPLHACVLAIALASPAFAGPPMVQSSKNYTGTQTQSAGVYGTGFYGAIQAGVNAHQEYRDRPEFRFSFEPDSKVGGIVGGKLGYVFGQEKIRPAVELDAFYNGFKARGAGFDSDLNTGAFLANFLVRFDLGRFQPYVGGGVGLYTAKFDAIDRGGNRGSKGDDSDVGWAWQVVAGSDYYFTEKLSAFLEYKYLNYETDGDVFGEGRIDQHIVALGLRVHF